MLEDQLLFHCESSSYCRRRDCNWLLLIRKHSFEISESGGGPLLVGLESCLRLKGQGRSIPGSEALVSSSGESLGKARPHSKPLAHTTTLITSESTLTRCSRAQVLAGMLRGPCGGHGSTSLEDLRRQLPAPFSMLPAMPMGLSLPAETNREP